MAEREWSDMQELKLAYEYTFRILKQLREKLPEQDGDRRIVGEMMADCTYVIEWLNTGRRPGNRRGIERLAGYQREKLMDPIQMQVFVNPPAAAGSSRLSERKRVLVKQALASLSKRERECYTLAYGECFSLAQIAEMLGISKSSSALYVRRAQKKIADYLSYKNLLNI
ncbi:sigma factor-like helix-turn-helix DNA-binding protein [Paenibacillus caui]|uniref:sigma factor-like helix-turn-helix DNA-binding protein n=1 Tax=Paenibacillus caui TaxID=2873927 RepID=UPI001F2A6D49|nr:sigma factor-like helix-turn-helix DNA-binding protein [Paenibacillus caui]